MKSGSVVPTNRGMLTTSILAIIVQDSSRGQFSNHSPNDRRIRCWTRKVFQTPRSASRQHGSLFVANPGIPARPQAMVFPFVEDLQRISPARRVGILGKTSEMRLGGIPAGVYDGDAGTCRCVTADQHNGMHGGRAMDRSRRQGAPFGNGEASITRSARRRPRMTLRPECESLDGRQLLTAVVSATVLVQPGSSVRRGGECRRDPGFPPADGFRPLRERPGESGESLARAPPRSTCSPRTRWP